MNYMMSVVYGFLAPLTKKNVDLLEDYAGGTYDDEASSDLWRVLELKQVEGVDITAYYTESLGRDMPRVIIVSLPGVGVENNEESSWQTITPAHLTPPNEITSQFREVKKLLGVEEEGWLLYSHVS